MASPLQVAHQKLDQAVREGCGMKKSEDPLAFLFDLNEAVTNKEGAA